MSRTVVAAGLIAACGVGLGPDRSSADEAKDELIREYKQKTGPLIDFYKHSVIRFRMTETTGRPNGEIIADGELRYNDPLVRCDMHFLKHPDKEKIGSDIAEVANRDRFFRLVRPAGVDPYRLEVMQQDVDLGQRVVLWTARVPLAAYGFLSQTVPDMLADGGLVITDRKQVTEGGRELVRVTGDLTVPMPQFPDKPGRYTRVLTLDPQLGWAVTGYSWWPTKTKSRFFHAAVSYDGAAEGIPLIKRVEYWAELPAAPGKKVDQTVVEVTAIDRRRVPAEDFTLEAFGITGVAGSNPAPRQWPAFLAGGAVLIVVGAGCLWAYHRRGPGRPPAGIGLRGGSGRQAAPAPGPGVPSPESAEARP